MFPEDGRSWRGGGAGASELRSQIGGKIKDFDRNCIYTFKKFQIIEPKRRKLSK